jgi:hypothetical protein
MMYSFWIWVGLAAVTLLLAGYRKVVANQEDDVLHLREVQADLVNKQSATAHRLETIDRWGKILTVVAVVYGLVLGLVYLYNGWMASAQLQ